MCMASLEEELREAISYRNEMAVEVAYGLLLLGSEDGTGEPQFIVNGKEIINGGYARRVVDIEALTAVILQRAGVPWDALAAPTAISKQALHRRLCSRGESLFTESLQESKWREPNPRTLIRLLHKAERTRNWEELDEVLRPLPVHSKQLIFNLVKLPMPEDILAAPPRLAANLLELKKIPQWWWGGE
jgi:hypothetical protein